MNTLAKTAPEVPGVTEQGHWAGALRGEGGGGFSNISTISLLSDINQMLIQTLFEHFLECLHVVQYMKVRSLQQPFAHLTNFVASYIMRQQMAILIIN